jgi:hypothetical protein
MELKDNQRFPTLKHCVKARIEGKCLTKFRGRRKKNCAQIIRRDHIRYDPEVFGQYPELLEPIFNTSKYLIKYQNNKIVGRKES